MSSNSKACYDVPHYVKATFIKIRDEHLTNLIINYLNKCAASPGETTMSVTNRPHCFGAQSTNIIKFLLLTKKLNRIIKRNI